MLHVCRQGGSGSVVYWIVSNVAAGGVAAALTVLDYTIPTPPVGVVLTVGMFLHEQQRSIVTATPSALLSVLTADNLVGMTWVHVAGDNFAVFAQNGFASPPDSAFCPVASGRYVEISMISKKVLIAYWQYRTYVFSLEIFSPMRANNLFKRPLTIEINGNRVR